MKIKLTEQEAEDIYLSLAAHRNVLSEKIQWRESSDDDATQHKRYLKQIEKLLKRFEEYADGDESD